MPDALATAFATPGLVWMVAASALAGITYGFAGFGSALVFMPIVSAFVPPQLAVASMSLIAVTSFFTVVPRAWSQCDRTATITLIATAMVTIPIGVWVLRVTDPDILRWAITAVTATTLGALVLGWRRTGPDTPAARIAVGAASGFTGGSTGLNGPILVLFQLSGQGSALQNRANTIIFLSTTGLAVVPFMALQGAIGAPELALGMLLALPYALGGLAGQALFVPGREHLYRSTAYAIIGIAIVMGLPVWR